jgi:integrase
VRKRLADGTVKEYRYPRHPPPKQDRYAADSLAALMIAYRRSTEWDALRPNSRAHYNRYLRHLEEAWHRPFAKLSRRFLLDMRDAVARGWGPAAGNCFIQATSALFAWARNRGWVEYSPVDRVPAIPGGHFPAWSMDQVAIALARFPEPLRRAVILGLHTGQRRGDLIAMTWSAYDGSVIRLRQAKTGAALQIPVHATLRSALERWKADRTATLILTTARGLPWSGTHLSTCFAQSVRDAGLPAGLNVHGLRKLAAASLGEAGCSALEIAAITGHRSLSMVALYTASADQRKLATAAIGRLEVAFGQPRKPPNNTL